MSPSLSTSDRWLEVRDLWGPRRLKFTEAGLLKFQVQLSSSVLFNSSCLTGLKGVVCPRWLVHSRNWVTMRFPFCSLSHGAECPTSYPWPIDWPATNVTLDRLSPSCVRILPEAPCVQEPDIHAFLPLYPSADHGDVPTNVSGTAAFLVGEGAQAGREGRHTCY